jgi:DNA repair protein RadD
VVPTGGGKSLIIAEFVRRTIEQWPCQRVVILTHVKELIEQNYNEFVGQWGLLAPIGIYSAGIGRRDTDSSVIFAGIQSVWPRLEKDDKEADTRTAEALGDFDLVLIDECHMLPKSGEGRYRSYLAWLKERNPKLKILGYTATPFRLEGGLLHKGEGRIFTDIAYDVSLKKLIDDNYLASLIAKLPKETIDTSGVGSSRGDYKPGELEAAAIAGDNVRCAVNEMIRMATQEERKHWLVFACGIAHANKILEQVRAAGISAEMVIGSTPKEDRRRIIRDAKAGDLTCLVNVGVLTTGFNWQRCDLLAVMRPTQSTSLYVQIMGRGMRTFPGKENCLVLDYGENVFRHGPINDIKITDSGAKGDGEAPVKACPDCSLIVSLGAVKCPGCGHVFHRESPESKNTNYADGLAPVDFTVHDNPKYTVDCSTVSFSRHSKKGKIDSMRVSYRCGMQQVNDWVCFEHTGFALRKAHDWWKLRGGLPVPDSVSEALDRISELLVPTQIIIQKDGKYDRVVDAIFKRERVESDANQPENEEQARTTGSDRSHHQAASGHDEGTEPNVGRPW